MTKTTSSKNKMFMNFDTYKNEEWLRRRRLRIEQVRKQSNEIAKALRQKATIEAKLRANEIDKINEENFKYWKAEKLDEMERKLRCALEEFGLGHKMAEMEPDPHEVIKLKNKINLAKAQERGEKAEQEELRRKRLTDAKKTVPIERMKMVRKIEDLRSALIRSVPAKRELFILREEEESITPDNHLQSVGTAEPEVIKTVHTRRDEEGCHFLRTKVKKVVNNKPTKKVSSESQSSNEVFKTRHCNSKASLSECEAPDFPETVWIDLNDAKASSVSDVGSKSKNSVKTLLGKSQTEKGDAIVEFYDYPSRYYSKSYRNVEDLVEKIDPDVESLQPDPVEVKKVQEEQELLEAKKKEQTEIARLERGNEALKKEKVSRAYNKLISKLENLHKKEKILKSQQSGPPDIIHMTDERISERERTKQRLMNSKFESIFYEATPGVPPLGPIPEVPAEESQLISGSGDYINPKDDAAVKLSFSSQNLKTNSPVIVATVMTSSVRFPREGERPRKITKTKVKRKKKKLLSDVEKTLKRGRKLREKACQSRGSSGRSSDGAREEPLRTKMRSAKEKKLRDQECQTEDLEYCRSRSQREKEVKPLRVDVEGPCRECCAQASTSTSYRSPPSAMTCERLHEFIDYLEGLREREKNSGRNAILQNNPELRQKIIKILQDLLYERNSATEIPEKCPHEKRTGPLEYYILKLLGMSREGIENLSVSSENISTPTMTDLEQAKDNEVEADKCYGAQVKLSKEEWEKRRDLVVKILLILKKILEEESTENAECGRPATRKLHSVPEEVCEKNEVNKPKPKDCFDGKPVEIICCYDDPELVKGKPITEAKIIPMYCPTIKKRQENDVSEIVNEPKVVTLKGPEGQSEFKNEYNCQNDGLLEKYFKEALQKYLRDQQIETDKSVIKSPTNKRERRKDSAHPYLDECVDEAQYRLKNERVKKPEINVGRSKCPPKDSYDSFRKEFSFLSSGTQYGSFEVEGNDKKPCPKGEENKIKKCRLKHGYAMEDINKYFLTDSNQKDGTPPCRPIEKNKGNSPVHRRMPCRDKVEEDENEFFKLASYLSDQKCCEHGEKASHAKDKKNKSDSLYTPKKLMEYEKITDKCAQRIKEISNLLKEIRKDRERLLKFPCTSSPISFQKENQKNKSCEMEDIEKDITGLTHDTTFLNAMLKKFNISCLPEGDIVFDPECPEPTESSVESLPDVVSQLIQKQILNSPFKWVGGNVTNELTSISKKEKNKCEKNKSEINKNEISKKEMSKNEISKKEMSKNEISKKEMSKNEISKKEMSKNEISKKEIKENEEKGKPMTLQTAIDKFRQDMENLKASFFSAIPNSSTIDSFQKNYPDFVKFMEDEEQIEADLKLLEANMENLKCLEQNIEGVRYLDRINEGLKGLKENNGGERRPEDFSFLQNEEENVFGTFQSFNEAVEGMDSELAKTNLNQSNKTEEWKAFSSNFDSDKEGPEEDMEEEEEEYEEEEYYY